MIGTILIFENDNGKVLGEYEILDKVLIPDGYSYAITGYVTKHINSNGITIISVDNINKYKIKD